MISEPSDILGLMQQLESSQTPFVLATVISVRGSASAKPGSKAVFAADGKCLLGWVGGGCAQSWVGSQSVEALREGAPREVHVDLSDEVFGLGMPCGGDMTVFVEPWLPKSALEFEAQSLDHEILSCLAGKAGYRAVFTQHPIYSERAQKESLSKSAEILATARGVCHARGASGLPLQSGASVRDWSVHGSIRWAAPTELLLIGSSLIVEELAILGSLCAWKVRTYGPTPPQTQKSITWEKSHPTLDNLQIQRDSAVVVASHHKGDVEFISRALASHAAWIGLVASRKRSELVLSRVPDLSPDAPVFAPAGLDLGCTTPFDIALSIIAAILTFEKS